MIGVYGGGEGVVDVEQQTPGLEKEIPIGNHHFEGRLVSF